MSIIVSEGKKTPPHPVGQYPAICIDVIDRGIVETQFGNKHKIIVRFFCGEFFKNDDDKDVPHYIGQQFTASLDERANLRKFLQAWRNRAFTPEELKGFDLEVLLGIPALLSISLNDEGTYANIDGCMRLPKEMNAPKKPDGYVRAKDRDNAGQNGSGQPGREPGEDDDLPF